MAVTIKNVQSLIPSVKRLFKKVAVKWAQGNFLDIYINGPSNIRYLASSTPLPLVIKYLQKPSKHIYKCRELSPETINTIFKQLYNMGQVMSPLETLTIGISIRDKSNLIVFIETKEYKDWDMNLLLTTLVPSLTMKYNIVPYMIWEADRGPYILNRIFDNHY